MAGCKLNGATLLLLLLRQLSKQNDLTLDTESANAEQSAQTAVTAGVAVGVGVDVVVAAVVRLWAWLNFHKLITLEMVAKCRTYWQGK